MKKINKIVNIAFACICIAIFLARDISYASCLRVPVSNRTYSRMEKSIDAKAAPSESTGVQILDLRAVRESLLGVRDKMSEISFRMAGEPNDSEERSQIMIIDHLMLGYEYLNRLLQEGRDLTPQELLTINMYVTIGENPEGYYSSIEATNEKFTKYYERIWGWYERNQADPYKLAAGMIVRIVQMPQLFIEGNKRTSAAIIANYILLKKGQPPFILTPENAPGYFSLIYAIQHKSVAGGLLGRVLETQAAEKRMEKFLRKNVDARFVLSSDAQNEPAGNAAYRIPNKGDFIQGLYDGSSSFAAQADIYPAIYNWSDKIADDSNLNLAIRYYYARDKIPDLSRSEIPVVIVNLSPEKEEGLKQYFRNRVLVINLRRLEGTPAPQRFIELFQTHGDAKIFYDNTPPDILKDIRELLDQALAHRSDQLWPFMETQKSL